MHFLHKYKVRKYKEDKRKPVNNTGFVEKLG